MLPLLTLKNLYTSYPSGFSLKNISLSINAGSVCALIGPNGSGKSTVIKAASGLIKIKNGTVEICGKNIEAMSFPERAKNIAVVLQQIPQIFDINVLEYVLLSRIPHNSHYSFSTSKQDIDIATEALKKCSAANFANRFMDELSGGEKQLIHIAKAIAQKTNILLLDEPTNHLDLAHQQQIMLLLRSLAENENLAIGVVLHDLNLAARFTDYIYLLHKGEIVASGPPDELINQDILEKVYSAKIAICKDPIKKKPLIFPPL